VTQTVTGRRPGGAAFAIAALLAAVAAVMLWDASLLRQDGGYAGVGPASVPRLVALGLIGLALWTLVEGLRGQGPVAPRQEPAPVLWILAGLVLELLLLHRVGFIISAAILFACTARGFGQRRIGLALGIGLVLTTLVYVLFDRLLKLNLPGGPIERLIFGG
jgi:putative tricarboxylic transport membrane protein